VLISCGSFNPPTNMHLRIFDLAKDALARKNIQVVAGIISPTHDEYKDHKPTLITSKHRVAMVQQALATNPWIKCSTWETEQQGWTRTVKVLEHQGQIIKDSTSLESGKFCHPLFPEMSLSSTTPLTAHPRLMLLCGGDLLESFSVPNLWSNEHIEMIARDFGLAVITRVGSNPEQYVNEHPILRLYKDNIQIVPSDANRISSTEVRKAVKLGESITDLVPESVSQYITENNLYTQ